MIDDKIVQEWMRDFDKEARITPSGYFITIMAEDGEKIKLGIDEYLQHRLNKYQSTLTNT